MRHESKTEVTFTASDIKIALIAHAGVSVDERLVTCEVERGQHLDGSVTATLTYSQSVENK